MKRNADGLWEIEGDGSFGFTVLVDGRDLLVRNVPATWFGGADDPQDDGRTASGISTRDRPSLLGCALPMDGFHQAATDGSPIPRLPWLTPVWVADHATPGRVVTVSLIDVGPAKPPAAHAAIDLTRAAFRSLCGDLEAGTVQVNYRIPGGAAHLPARVRAQMKRGG